jgi:signal transduction histidine kinase
LNEVADGRRDKVQAINYGRSDGLGAFQFTGGFQPAACRSRDGTYWFSSVKGVVAFRSSEIMQYLEPPKILLKEILWDNHPLNLGTTPRLPPESRQLEFHFTTPVLGAPDRVRFRFKLEGLDNTWVENSRLRSAVYSGLRPGNYVFRVAACNPDGIWNEPGISFAFSIAPHFWQTNWFVAGLASLVAGALAFALRYAAVRRLERRLLVVEKQHAVEKERARIAQDIHDELGANLTSIGWLADVGRKVQSQPEVVLENLNKISSTARQSLTAMDAIVWALSPRNDSLDHFANYVAHYAEDFFRPTKIRCRMDIPPNLADRPMSTEARHHLFLALKEALNNVVKHSQATEVLVRLYSNAEELCLSVEDNGKGLPPNAAVEGQDGLVNIRNRVEGLGGCLTIEAKSGQGLSLNLRLPWALLKPH